MTFAMGGVPHAGPQQQTLKGSSGSGVLGSGPSHTGLGVGIPDVEPESFAG